MSSSIANLNDWLAYATATLEQAGIGTARLDALVMLEDELCQDRSRILAFPEAPLHSDSIEKLNTYLARRAEHEPLAYIRGKSEFYGREFYINQDVLEPRPESEAIIEELRWLRLPMRPRLADIGTGSGCLGITAALEIRGVHVEMYDIDEKCLSVAEINAKSHGLSLRFNKADLLGWRPAAYDVILANLPYVPNRYKINRSAQAEPKIAIFGGNDGLDVYRRLFERFQSMPIKPKFVLTEALPTQHIGLAGIAEFSGFKQVRHNDFVQVFESIY